jgi:hypothetical protein
VPPAPPSLRRRILPTAAAPPCAATTPSLARLPRRRASPRPRQPPPAPSLGPYISGGGGTPGATAGLFALDCSDGVEPSGSGCTAAPISVPQDARAASLSTTRMPVPPTQDDNEDQAVPKFSSPSAISNPLWTLLCLGLGFLMGVIPICVLGACRWWCRQHVREMGDLHLPVLDTLMTYAA